MDAQQIIDKDKVNNVSPEITLQRLFALDHFLSEKGTAFINVKYWAHKAEGYVSGSNVIKAALLNKHDFTVSRSHTGHINVTINDYINYFWPENGGTLCLADKNKHRQAIEKMHAHPTHSKDKTELKEQLC